MNMTAFKEAVERQKQAQEQRTQQAMAQRSQQLKQDCQLADIALDRRRLRQSKRTAKCVPLPDFKNWKKKYAVIRRITEGKAIGYWCAKTGAWHVDENELI